MRLHTVLGWLLGSKCTLPNLQPLPSLLLTTTSSIKKHIFFRGPEGIGDPGEGGVTGSSIAFQERSLAPQVPPSGPGDSSVDTFCSFLVPESL